MAGTGSSARASRMVSVDRGGRITVSTFCRSRLSRFMRATSSARRRSPDAIIQADTPITPAPRKRTM